MKDHFYISTPIYYVNDVPHIGHAYTTLAADAIARYHRLRGEKVFFLTGTDEHGQNVARAAEQRGVDPKAWTDEIAPKWQDVWKRLHVSNDDFIRTTEERHERPVRQFFQRLYDRGQIYQGTYEGAYCVSCEEFKTPGELVDGKCPIHDRPVEHLKEENYFFRLSEYRDRLLELIEDQPDFVRPETRRNEVVSFVAGGLDDISISRRSVAWGIPLPWDESQVAYVWVDALQNYITAAGFGSDPARFDAIWPADVHLIGKDILRFHAVIWPAMLMAAELPLPRSVFAHGYLLVSGQKMSKTRLTGIHPFDIVDQFGVDAFRYYFLREVPFGQDGNFSWESMKERYNTELANGLGNLASRVLAMVDSYFDGVVPEPSGTPGRSLAAAAEALGDRYDRAFLALELTDGVAALAGFVRDVNRHLVQVAPWALAKDPARRAELADSLYEATEALRIIALYASPVMPITAAELNRQLGLPATLAEAHLPEAGRWGLLAPGTRIVQREPLFPRFQD